MSQSVIFNNTSYLIPSTGDVNWGDNVTSYLVAIAAGAFQLSGGSFFLTSEANFGPNFGLASLYYKSRSTNVASTGILRLAKTDTIDWRNNANSGDLALAINGSDQLMFNGALIPTGAATFVSSITGTAHQVIASASTGAVTLSTPQSIDTVSSPTFASLTLTAPLTVGNGGTGQSSFTNGQLLIGNTTGNTLTKATLSSASSNQINITNGAGSITIGTPQDIGTSSSPTFFDVFINDAVSLQNRASIVFKNTGSIEAVTVQAPSSLSSYPLVWPQAQGAANKTWINDGSGNMSFATLPVAGGGTGATSLTAYSVICGGTSSTGAVQSVSGVGSSGQVLTSNGASALPTWQTVSGSGTVNSGTIGRLALYPSSSNVVGDTYTQSAHSATVQIPAIGQTTAWNFVDPGIAASYIWGSPTSSPTANSVVTTDNVGNLVTTNTINSSVSMASHKITSLANGTAATDAMAFGQNHIVQIQSASGTGAGNTTSTSFTTTGTPVQASITPTSSSNKIRVTASATFYSDSTTLGAQTFFTIFRGVTNLGAGISGFGNVVVYISSATSDNVQTVTMVYIDSPATTSSTTYSVQIRSNAGTTTSAISKNSEPWTVVLEEIQ